MKAQVLTGTTAASESIARVRVSTLFLGSIIMVLLFSIVYIRQMTIRAGYDISSLVQQTERADIDYAELISVRSESYDSEHLYTKAKELGMSLPDVRRTYYVKE